MQGSSHRRVLSLFSGAGGLDLGLERAGWDVLAQVEMHSDARATLLLHGEDLVRPPLVIGDRVENVDPCLLRRRLALKKGELELLAGGPPCQPFTTSGLRRALQDRRASSLFPTYLAYVEEFKPQALLVENVDGMLSAALRHRPLNLRGNHHAQMTDEEMKGSFLRWLLEQLGSLGYAVSWGVAEAADYGVPQMRQRAILTAALGREPCYLPAATHGGQGQPPLRTLREALAEVAELGPVQPLSQRKRDVYRLVPAGGNWRDLPREVQRQTMGAAFTAEGGRSGWWRRSAWDQPAPTILGMPDHSSTALIHPDEVRCLSVNECAAVQSFPSGTPFAGTPRSQYQQIGNAVPPLLGRALGSHLASFLDGHRDAEPAPPEWRKASANRRIGTHGWVVPRHQGTDLDFHLSVHVRADHVWARPARSTSEVA